MLECATVFSAGLQLRDYYVLLDNKHFVIMLLLATEASEVRHSGTLLATEKKHC